MNLSPKSRDFYNYVGLDMHIYWNRLFTLQAIKTDKVKKEDLARYGFFYFGQGDLVECYHCGISLGTWAPGDQPRDEHLKYSSDCPIAKEEPIEEPPEPRQTHAAYQNMSRLDERRHSFYIWPSVMENMITPLTEAGFFYTGTGDETRCFFCSGILDNWRLSDNPWERHAEKFPWCEYVRVNKGLTYIVNLKFRANFNSDVDSAPVTLPLYTKYSDAQYKDKCVLCKEREREIVFDKCGHIIVCQECESSSIDGNICPLCELPYDHAIKFFRS